MHTYTHAHMHIDLAFCIIWGLRALTGRTGGSQGFEFRVFGAYRAVGPEYMSIQSLHSEPAGTFFVKHFLWQSQLDNHRRHCTTAAEYAVETGQKPC